METKMHPEVANVLGHLTAMEMQIEERSTGRFYDNEAAEILSEVRGIVAIHTAHIIASMMKINEDTRQPK